MRKFAACGIAGVIALCAAAAQAEPRSFDQLSFRQETSPAPAQLSQAPNERRLDKYRPYLKSAPVAQTEIAAFEEVNREQRGPTRPSRPDRAH